MKHALTCLLAALAVHSVAAANPELAAKKNCLACHAIDKKIVGPSYRDVAAKYAGQAGAEAMLGEKIQKGGVGAWGQIPMPANQVTSAEAKQLAAWVLTQKK